MQIPLQLVEASFELRRYVIWPSNFSSNQADVILHSEMSQSLISLTVPPLQIKIDGALVLLSHRFQAKWSLRNFAHTRTPDICKVCCDVKSLNLSNANFRQNWIARKQALVKCTPDPEFRAALSQSVYKIRQVLWCQRSLDELRYWLSQCTWNIIS